MERNKFEVDSEFLEITRDVADELKRGRSIQSRGWIMTIKAEQYDKDAVEKLLSSYSYVGQLESGKSTGYLHWQIYIENANPIKFATLKNKFPNGAWFAPRLGTKLQALTYVSKTDTAQGVKIRNGEINMTEDGKRSDLEGFAELIRGGASVNEVIYNNNKAVKYANWLDRLKKAVDEEERASKWRVLDVEYMWGSTGVGKSRSLNDRFDDMYVVSNYEHPFDQYRGEDVIVFDEFSSQLPIELMLRALDGYKFYLPSRYEDRLALYTKVFIVSNKSLADQYPWVQQQNPEQFKALRRRINRVNHIDLPLYEDISVQLAPLY